MPSLLAAQLAALAAQAPATCLSFLQERIFRKFLIKFDPMLSVFKETVPADSCGVTVPFIHSTSNLFGLLYIVPHATAPL